MSVKEYEKGFAVRTKLFESCFSLWKTTRLKKKDKNI